MKSTVGAVGDLKLQICDRAPTAITWNWHDV